MNIAKCAQCKSIIRSKHVHDFVRCKCGAIFIDGGEEYYRRDGLVEDFATMTSEDIENASRAS